MICRSKRESDKGFSNEDYILRKKANFINCDTVNEFCFKGLEIFKMFKYIMFLNVYNLG